MKTAIILTGHMRSFSRCLPNLHWMVFRHFPNADFFVSTVQDENTASADMLRIKYPHSQVEIEAVPAQPEMLMPVGCPLQWTKGQSYTHEPYSISVPPQAVLAQLWQLNEGWQLYKKTAKERHDVIIRCRPDLWFHSFALPPIKNPEADVAFTPWWGRFGGINDRFALLGRDAALAYFTTFQRVESLWKDGCPIHPESLVYASLRSADIYVADELKAEFSSLRTSGEMRPPEITAIDIAHFSKQ